MAGKLRIIGGKWRGRRLNFTEIPGLRPTPDRVRETVFNWLMMDIQGAVCLDLFAGSGALGFEALSRGAKHVVLVDESRRVIEKLKENAEILGASADIDFYCLQMPRFLAKVTGFCFDIVFLDPPFHKGLLAPTCRVLEEFNCLAKNALIYIEEESELDLSDIVPASWTILHSKRSGQVGYHLCSGNNS